MGHLSVSAVGRDRPGIVAGVTRVLLDHGCNLEDTSMTILRGHFAMMLVVAVPPDVDPGALERALSPVAEAHHLVVAVRPLEDDVPSSPEGDSWTVSIYGADRPGIVHRVASLLAGESVNIVDLTTRVIGSPERSVYVMVIEVTLPVDVEPEALEARLGELAAELGVECSLHASEADIL